jgi:hypothetical protein
MKVETKGISKPSDGIKWKRPSAREARIDVRTIQCGDFAEDSHMAMRCVTRHEVEDFPNMQRLVGRGF